MFSHRVLPPLSSSSLPHTLRRPGSGVTGLSQHKIMTSDEFQNHTIVNQINEYPSHRSNPDDHSQSSESDQSPSTQALSEDQTRQIKKLPPPLPDAARAGNVPIPASKICLCQPDPKVPRPRNAFILYRQHHQAAVVARNPGLANPKISKIIGDHWRASSDEVKEHWKSLAEEEKIRHQKQYPDYRYQPRRGTSKNNSESVSPTTAAEYRCPKCGGRNITSSGLGTPTMALSGPFINLPQKSPSTTAGAGYRQGQMHSPPTPYSAEYRRATAYPGRQAFPATSDHAHLESRSPTSPDPKRRRVEYSPHSLEHPHRGPIGLLQHQEILPRPELVERRGTMAAPLQRPYHQRAQRLPTPLHLKRDTSERLPNPKTGITLDGTAQAFSVDAMVNSILSVNKVKVLAKISPSLPIHSPTSPPFAVRGAVIAVDGAEAEAVSRVTAYVQDFLIKDNEYNVHIWDGSPPSNRSTNFSEYLRLTRDWHWKSQQIVHHITTLPNPLSPTPVSPRTVPPTMISSSGEGISLHRPLETPLETTTRRESCIKDGLSEDGVGDATASASRRMSCISAVCPVPIALIPHFQLSQTDFFASRIPITDSYAPIDHWQWMATLWRGIVGPDITIVVKPPVGMEPQPPSSGKDSASYSKSLLSNGSVMGDDTGDSHATAITPGVKKAGVELRLQEAKTIVMNSIGDKDLRRVAFEVGEWVREKVLGQGMGVSR